VVAKSVVAKSVVAKSEEEIVGGVDSKTYELIESFFRHYEKKDRLRVELTHPEFLHGVNCKAFLPDDWNELFKKTVPEGKMLNMIPMAVCIPPELSEYYPSSDDSKGKTKIIETSLLHFLQWNRLSNIFVKYLEFCKLPHLIPHLKQIDSITQMKKILARGESWNSVTSNITLDLVFDEEFIELDRIYSKK
jgi:hypothetical protein